MVNVIVRFLFAFLYLHVVNRDIWFATSPPRDILQSECDRLQNPGFEVYHIHSEVYYVAVTWQNRCFNLQRADIGRRIRNGRQHSMLTTSTG